MQTRSQQLSKQVFEQIMPMKESIDEETDSGRKTKLKKAAKTYGSLCHNFPVMVLRSGLSQAVAFVWVKAKENSDSPHGKFLSHLSELTNATNNETPQQFQARINTLPLAEYQRLTRIILTASIWYKRFAESLLDVKAGDSTGDE